MAAEPQQRPDGFVLTYLVEVVFDTNASRTRYDHVGTVARCTGCVSGSTPPAPRLPSFATLAATSPPALPAANSGDRQLTVASLRREEVITEHTTA